MRFLHNTIPVNELECCPHVDEYNLPRIDPPLHSKSFGWSNSSGLKYYEERICAKYAIYECNLNKNRNGSKVMIQFVNYDNEIVYEDTGDENVAILVNCTNGKWILNNKTFSNITCSQT